MTTTESLTALVVDDDPTARYLLKSVLERLRFRVVEAELGVDGLQRMRETRPDLLILDVVMPHMDGLDTLKYLRTDPQFASLPVIVVSVLPEDHSLVRQFRELGIAGYFTKPLDQKRLSVRLNALFGRNDAKVD